LDEVMVFIRPTAIMAICLAALAGTCVVWQRRREQVEAGWRAATTDALIANQAQQNPLGVRRPLLAKDRPAGWGEPLQGLAGPRPAPVPPLVAFLRKL
jgi:hypothetical protein